MSRAMGIHTIEIKPGINENEFEEFIYGENMPVYAKVPGQSAHLLEGDRGERSGKYLLLIKLVNVERRNEIYLVEGQFVEDVEQLVGNVNSLWEKFYTFVEELPEPASTDYVVMSD